MGSAVSTLETQVDELRGTYEGTVPRCFTDVQVVRELRKCDDQRTKATKVLDSLQAERRALDARIQEKITKISELQRAPEAAQGATERAGRATAWQRLERGARPSRKGHGCRH